MLIKVKRLSTSSVFKVIGIGLFLSVIPLSLIAGLFALFGAHTVQLNNEPATGIKGLLSASLIGLVWTMAVTLILGTLCALGLWIFSRFSPLELSVKELDNQ
ncbi:MAG TPA: hypothetical protein VJ302_06450 [Blastocatellia bacterium]|nr:hypothetical protein [Blastocatellia bacterium]